MTVVDVVAERPNSTFAYNFSIDGRHRKSCFENKAKTRTYDRKQERIGRNFAKLGSATRQGDRQARHLEACKRQCRAIRLSIDVKEGRQCSWHLVGMIVASLGKLRTNHSQV